MQRGVVQLQDRASVERPEPRLQIAEQLQQRVEFGANHDVVRAAKPAQRLADGGGVDDRGAALWQVHQAAFVILDQQEPTDRHLPRALLHEGHRRAVLSATLRQLSRRLASDVLGHEVFRELSHLGLAQRQQGMQHADPHAPGTGVALAIDGTEVGTLRVIGDQ